MGRLRDHDWRCKYTPSDGDLLTVFYVPVLGCARRYDRTTGYFCADTLAAATLGVEGLVRNKGRMRLVVGCTLGEPEAEAVLRGESLRGTVEACLLRCPLRGDGDLVRDGLELLAWLVAKGIAEIRVAVPCEGPDRVPVAGQAVFHEKSGIVEDAEGDRVVFNGSLNETVRGWTRNWDSFHVFRSWRDDAEHLDADEETFARLWADRDDRALVLALPEAVRDRLLGLLPPDGALPARLRGVIPEPDDALRAETWRFIRRAPAETGDETVGMATAAVTPWPHQVEAFLRMYRNWPPRLLIADEVGLGKTVQAGMLLRQAWITGKARRVLVMAPPPVLRQWQRELREKFNLDVPVYESGRLSWIPSPSSGRVRERTVPDDAWHREPFVLASSHLMRRGERRRQILEDAEPWDVVVLDEAHHARRSGSSRGAEKDEPNQLLRLMRGIRDKGKAKGLVLLTATPMQVDPIEVWDLLSLLGLPEEWTPDAFLGFYDEASDPVPTPLGIRRMARLVRAMERMTGRTFGTDDVVAIDPEHSPFTATKVVAALRSEASVPVLRLSDAERVLARRVLTGMSPTRLLISRHTRELLRRYRGEGALASNIAVRRVDDVAVAMTEAERAVYGAVEDYISATYARASAKERTAVGFVMTVYHRRLASSFRALSCTLERRLDRVGRMEAARVEEDLPDDEIDECPDLRDAEESMELASASEEREEIRFLLGAVRRLPVDGKVRILLGVLDGLRSDGYRQAVVFTQFTDTLDELRDLLTERYGEGSTLCFSGRGGERRVPSGWEPVSRETTKAMFRAGAADVLLCTDAAAEGLNFQFCGALVNYDMPWNPMRVEQRIGRIDRLGQAFDVIRVVNLMYEDTIEYDVYCRLRERIDLFRAFVGRLQPILSRLPRTFKELAMRSRDERGAALEKARAGIDLEIEKAGDGGFDLDDDDVRPDVPETAAPAYGLAFLQEVLEDPARRPKGCTVERLAGGRDYAYTMPGGRGPVRVTTDPAYYEEHSESCELWSPGSPTFPWEEDDPQGMPRHR